MRTIAILASVMAFTDKDEWGKIAPIKYVSRPSYANLQQISVIERYTKRAFDVPDEERSEDEVAWFLTDVTGQINLYKLCQSSELKYSAFNETL